MTLFFSIFQFAFNIRFPFTSQSGLILHQTSRTSLSSDKVTCVSAGATSRPDEGGCHVGLDRETVKGPPPQNLLHRGSSSRAGDQQVRSQWHCKESEYACTVGSCM